MKKITLYIILTCLSLLAINPSLAKTKAEIILQNGIAHIDSKNTKKALTYYKQLDKHPIEQQIMAWVIAVYGENVDFNSLQVLAKHLDGWPAQTRMKHNIERSIINSNNDTIITQAFANKQPSDLDATLELARYYFDKNKKQDAYRIIAPLWREGKLDKKQEQEIKNKFNSILQIQETQARIELLLGEKLLNRAKALAKDANMEDLVAARIAVERNEKNAGAKLRPLYKTRIDNPNFLLSLAKFFRQHDEIIKAAQTLLASPPPHKNAGDIFQTEQRIVAAKLMEQNQFKIAYKLVARNVAKSPVKRIDSEFYAGWIALRFLNDAKTAQQHFEFILKYAKKPLSISRGHYWLARTLQKQNKRTKALIEYRKAAYYDASFYGQLALAVLNNRTIEITKPKISKQTQQEFEKYIFMQAVKKLERIGHKSKANLFYRHMAKNLENVAHINLLIENVQKKGNYPFALQLAKIAHQNGKKVKNLAWPVGVIPLNKNKKQTSLAYAISRQESTFQIDARSKANALGLMQLLPSTAKVSAKKAGLTYSISRLTRDAAYNARLGTTYLNEQIKEFNDSYILAFAAYNAGPTKVKKWIKRFGDPTYLSLHKTIDWIEKIPYGETRNYVQRVMENYQIYKARLTNEKLTIDKDLTRN